QRLALLLEVVPGPDRRTALLGGEVPVRAVLEHAPMGPVVVATDGACLTGVLERPATRGAGVLAEVLPAPVPLGPAGDLRRRAGQGGPTGGAPGAKGLLDPLHEEPGDELREDAGEAGAGGCGRGHIQNATEPAGHRKGVTGELSAGAQPARGSCGGRRRAPTALVSRR